MKAMKQYRGLPKPIYWIFLARLVNTMGAFVHPFLAIYLTETLGYSTAQAGGLCHLLGNGLCAGGL